MSYDAWLNALLGTPSAGYLRMPDGTIIKNGQVVSDSDLQALYKSTGARGWDAQAQQSDLAKIVADKKTSTGGSNIAQLGKFALQDVATIGAGSLKTNNFDPDRPGFLMPSTFYPSIKTANTSGMTAGSNFQYQQGLKIGKG